MVCRSRANTHHHIVRCYRLSVVYGLVTYFHSISPAAAHVLYSPQVQQTSCVGHIAPLLPWSGVKCRDLISKKQRSQTQKYWNHKIMKAGENRKFMRKLNMVWDDSSPNAQNQPDPKSKFLDTSEPRIGLTPTALCSTLHLEKQCGSRVMPANGHATPPRRRSSGSKHSFAATATANGIGFSAA